SRGSEESNDLTQRVLAPEAFRALNAMLLPSGEMAPPGTGEKLPSGGITENQSGVSSAGLRVCKTAKATATETARITATNATAFHREFEADAVGIGAALSRIHPSPSTRSEADCHRSLGSLARH